MTRLRQGFDWENCNSFLSTPIFDVNANTDEQLAGTSVNSHVSRMKIKETIRIYAISFYQVNIAIELDGD